MRNLGHFFQILADVLGVTAFIGIIILTFCDYRIPDGLNIHSFLVGILSVMVTLLVTWNIYSTIDSKNLRIKLDREINYAHNKTDYNQALTYAMLSQTLSTHFAANEDDSLKYQMLINGIQAIKIFSNFSDCEKEINAIVKTLIKGLDNSNHIHLSEHIKMDLILSCGEIKHRDKIEQFDRLIELLKDNTRTNCTAE